MLALHVLGSGSKGNAAIVEDVETGRGVAIDCGLCKRDFMGRAASAGFDPSRIDAFLLTHDHSGSHQGAWPASCAVSRSRRVPLPICSRCERFPWRVRGAQDRGFMRGALDAP